MWMLTADNSPRRSLIQACAAQSVELAQTIEFVLELDRLKQVLRQTTLTDGSRRENSAEHSWHIALMAIALSNYAVEALDVNHAVLLLLLHDVVEIDAGDTFCFDAQANQSQAEREQQAAERLFGLLPEPEGRRLRTCWYEFEAGATPEARYARAMDCLQPFLHNLATRGGTWKQHGVSSDRVYARMLPVQQATPALWGFVETQIQGAIAAGWLTTTPTTAAPTTDSVHP